MNNYRYRAVTQEGGVVTGHMTASDHHDLEQRLRGLRLDLLSCRPMHLGRWLPRRQLPRRHLVDICFHLAQLTRSGIPLLDGLHDLRDSVDQRRLREILIVVVTSIENGRTLSQALAEHLYLFGGVFVSLIRAGEESGCLPEVLAKLVDSLKWQDELAGQSKRLLMYPLFMVAVVTATTLFMLVYLVPRLTVFLTGLGKTLPWQTRILIYLSEFLTANWAWLLALLLFCIGAATFWLHMSSSGRNALDRMKLRLPLFGPLRRKLILARFADVLAMMYAAGIPLLDALRTIGGVLGNREVERGIGEAAALIADGRGLSAAFASTGVFPPLVVRMLRVGETTGALDAALANVSYFFGREVRESIARVQAMIEPTMTVIVGVVLGWVVLAVLGPVYDAVASIRL